MRNSEQLFAIHNEAYTARVNNVDVRSTSEGTVYSILLQLQHSKSSFFDYNISCNENGKNVSADNIIHMRIGKILLGAKHKERYGDSAFNLTEHAIMQLQNSAMKVIANLILTNTLEKIEFEVVDGYIVNVNLNGFVPKYYSNVEATRIELDQTIAIDLGNIIQN